MATYQLPAVQISIVQTLLAEKPCAAVRGEMHYPERHNYRKRNGCLMLSLANVAPCELDLTA
jgi:hypothetical protein